MSNRLLPGLAILAAAVLGVTVWANEPDGRIVFRYSWPDGKDAGADAPRVRVSLTAVTALTDAHLVARIPSGVGIAMRHGVASGAWPADGIEIGDLAAGQTVVVELDVAKPEHGGGILGLVLQATAAGGKVSEGVGVPIGVPGTAPTLRNGAVEFPAASADPAP